MALQYKQFDSAPAADSATEDSASGMDSATLVNHNQKFPAFRKGKKPP